MARLPICRHIADGGCAHLLGPLQTGGIPAVPPKRLSFRIQRDTDVSCYGNSLSAVIYADTCACAPVDRAVFKVIDSADSVGCRQFIGGRVAETPDFRAETEILFANGTVNFVSSS